MYRNAVDGPLTGPSAKLWESARCRQAPGLKRLVRADGAVNGRGLSACRTARRADRVPPAACLTRLGVATDGVGAARPAARPCWRARPKRGPHLGRLRGGAVRSAAAASRRARRRLRCPPPLAPVSTARPATTSSPGALKSARRRAGGLPSCRTPFMSLFARRRRRWPWTSWLTTRKREPCCRLARRRSTCHNSRWRTGMFGFDRVVGTAVARRGAQASLNRATQVAGTATYPLAA